MTQKKERRRKAILEYVRSAARTSVEELCTTFGVSEATIRRDLADLDAQHRLLRTLGGAYAADGYVSELPMLSRIEEMKAEKNRIGRAAAELVNDGDVIFLSSGTTTLYMIPYLESKDDLTVITNSLPAANRVAQLPNAVNLVVVGGTYRESEQSFLGKPAIRELEALRASKLFIGVRSIHPHHGLTNVDLAETEVDRQIVSTAETVIVLADHTKFDARAPAFLCDIEDVQTIITDDGLDPATYALFAAFAGKIRLV